MSDSHLNERYLAQVKARPGEVRLEGLEDLVAYVNFELDVAFRMGRQYGREEHMNFDHMLSGK